MPTSGSFLLSASWLIQYEQTISSHHYGRSLFCYDRLKSPANKSPNESLLLLVASVCCLVSAMATVINIALKECDSPCSFQRRLPISLDRRFTDRIQDSYMAPKWSEKPRNNGKVREPWVVHGNFAGMTSNWALNHIRVKKTVLPMERKKKKRTELKEKLLHVCHRLKKHM